MTPAMLTLALSALWPQPREVAQAPLTTFVLPVRVEAPDELSAPAALLRRELAQAFGSAGPASGEGSVVRLALAPEELTRPEEYAVEPGGGGEYCSWGYLDPGTNNYRDRYQSVPTNWGINTERKQAFFAKMREVTDGG